VRRRAALRLLLACAAGARGAGAARAAGDVAGALLVWGPAGIAIAEPGAPLQWLPGAAAGMAFAVPPVPVAGGLWMLAGERRIAGWRRGASGDGSVTARHDLDAPVHALAAVSDGAQVLAAHGDSLSLLDARGALLRRYEGIDLQRRRRGRARGLFHHAGRRSFVAAWPDLGELWEIALDPAAEPIYDGLVHDHRLGEGLATPGHLGVRRAPLDAPMADLGFADARVPWVAGRHGERVDVVHLDVRRRIAQWTLPGARPDAALLRGAPGAWTWWLLTHDMVQVIDAARWQTVDRIAAPGRVQALQPFGESVCALCGEAGQARLVLRRGDGWEPLPLPTGTPLACAADAAGARIAVLTAAPAMLWVLGGDGRVQGVETMAGTMAGAPAGSPGLAGMRWLPG
jgi:hypothetical protein